ncbi:hypothetical protein [Spongiactinospora sp. TRM90649]|uniref:hypothetical protein n=1 Tax=Spongiactinospora sp. TRM90649 TaxID=3031114 RepID=UPI0023F98B61|nr:hypothetical protein [Spongiactinospora sp. TRM90649]MDF5753780.1 hypothetical protein [Spongiactinospora sp. TRM90649]
MLLALGGVTVGSPAAAALPGPGCDPKENGLVSNLAEDLCGFVDGVTDVVDDLTDNRLKPVTKDVDDTGDKLLGGKGDRASPTSQPSTPGPTPPPSRPTGPRRDRPTDPIDGLCLPLVTTGGCARTPSPAPSGKRNRTPGATPAPLHPSPTPFPSPSPSGERERDDRAEVITVQSPPPPTRRTHSVETQHRVKPPPVDPETPRFEPLWPYSDPLPLHVEGGKPIVPPDRHSDLLGTVLTAGLLLSAILAARISHTRRAREQRPDSIPFEPAHGPRNSRHKLA